MLTPSAMQLTRQFLRTQCCRKIYCGERKSIEEIKKILSRTEYKVTSTKRDIFKIDHAPVSLFNGHNRSMSRCNNNF